MKKEKLTFTQVAGMAAGYLLIAVGASIILFKCGKTLIDAGNRSADEYRKRMDDQVHSNLTYNIVHPEIVGTNENGEVIKRYYMPDYGHWVYEIGDTKTSNRNLGKAGLQVTVEKD